jgi:hypothetical protein
MESAEEVEVKPIEPLQEAPRHDGVDGQPRPRPIVATLGGLAVAAGVASVALVAFNHNPDAFTPSPAAVIRADPPSPPPPGTTGNPDQQPRRVCTHWDPENNTTQDRPCDNPS